MMVILSDQARSLCIQPSVPAASLCDLLVYAVLIERKLNQHSVHPDSPPSSPLSGVADLSCQSGILAVTGCSQSAAHPSQVITLAHSDGGVVVDGDLHCGAG